MTQLRTLELLPETLLIISCSGDKRSGRTGATGRSILSDLNRTLGADLAAARSAIHDKAGIDETTLMPAHLRYSGQLYKFAGSAIQKAVEAGQHILIVSGGYGLLRAEEPIGQYKKILALRDWPRNLLAKCILDYAVRNAIRDVIAVMSACTTYARLIRQVMWKSAGLSAKLVSPVSKGGGAQLKVPRAQGQAIAELLSAGLNQDWRSSDLLELRVTQM